MFKLKTIGAILAVVMLSSYVLGAPGFWISKPPVIPAAGPGSDTGPPQDINASQGQWFRIVTTGAEEVRETEFYDNEDGAGGGFAGTFAIYGNVTAIVYGGPGGTISQFQLTVTITNDMRGGPGLPRPGAIGNSHGETHPNPGDRIEKEDTLFRVLLTTEFADDPATVLPGGAPFGPEPIIDAVAFDAWAWYCYNSGNGGYWVPAYDFGDIWPGGFATRTLTFNVPGGAPPWLQIILEDSHLFQMDITVNRTNSLKISEYGENLFNDVPWTPVDFSDVSVFYECCQKRGDVDHGCSVNVTDLMYLVDYLFRDGPPPPCLEEGDADGDGSINVGDLMYLVYYLFLDGPAPPPCR